MVKVARVCIRCTKAFLTDRKYVNRGHGKYCSLTCSSRGRLRRHHEPNLTCVQCSKPFHRSPARQQNSKSGLFFCGRICKELAQRIGGMEQLQLPHYGTGKSRTSYLNTARRYYDRKCAACGYDRELKALDVHHIDRNRANGAADNLAILCSNCHREIHAGSRENMRPFRFIGRSELVPEDGIEPPTPAFSAQRSTN